MDYHLPKVGDRVNVIEKRNYGSGKLTTGVVRRLLSNPNEVHPRGNKVELADGTVGRTVSFVDEVGSQKLVDPAEREKYAAEIRASRNQESRIKNQDRQRGQRERRFDRSATVSEPPINPNDLPGEDDLR